MNTFPKDSRVIFIGDSITAQCNYTTRVADYYNKNLPELNVKFALGAVSGSTLNHAIKYFEKLVLPFKPTHATIFYGINDCGRGALNLDDKDERYNKLKAAYDRYCANLEIFLDMLIAHDITPILITPAPYAEFMSADTAAYPHGHRVMYEYAEVVRAAAKCRGLDLIDFHARMSELYMIEADYGADRVHPSDLGQHRLAECLLRTQGLELGEYIPLSDITADEKICAWRTAAYRFCRIFGMYVCVMPELYDMSIDEQLNIVNEYVLTRGYGDNNVRRDFSTEFVVLKPREQELIARIAELNGD